MHHPEVRRSFGPLFAAIATTAAFGGGLDIRWYTVDGGGGASSGGTFTLIGTIGQHDAGPSSGAMTGGAISLVGGFWPGAEDLCTPAGDMNGDRLRDGADVQLFVNCVLNVNGADCACADMDGGGVHESDVAAFVATLLG